MASLPEGTTEEREQLLSIDNAPGPRESDEESRTKVSVAIAEASGKPRQEEATSRYRYSEPVLHYKSISVDCLFPSDENPRTGSAQVIERDLGEENDFWNIHVDFVWKPRGPKTKSSDSADNDKQHIQPMSVAVDDFLTLRLRLDSEPASVTIHLRGGKLLGQFLFPNGPDAAMVFMTALRGHVNTLVLEDADRPGELFAVEKKERMRRVAPSLTSTATEPNRIGDDFSSLLDDLTLRAPSSSARGGHQQGSSSRRNRRQTPNNGDFGMMVLSQFAKVTQVAREVGEDIATFLDEKKRRAEAERKERERAARRRALDIYADIVASTDVERELPPRLCLEEKRGVPVSRIVWEQSFDDSGTLTDPAVMKQAIFAGGVERNARYQVWPFILGFYPWDSSQGERCHIASQRNSDYEILKEKWKFLQASAKAADSVSLTSNPDAVKMDRRKRVSKSHAEYLETEEQIAKDIVRTDRQVNLYMQDDAPATLVMGTLLNVYATYDNRITYCQGMSDFLSPIIHVLGVDDESLAFWCFESLMRQIEGNFRVDQTGMRTQLSKLQRLVEIADEELAGVFEESDPDYYCCFRWILVWFKRELPFESTPRLWEVIWTRQGGGDDLHVFIAAALLIAHRRQLLSLQKGAFDCLLRYVNDMSMRIDVDFALREGELCFRKYGALLE